MAKIIAPNKQYTGLSASVSFYNGIGETDRTELIEWFRKHGYEVMEENTKEEVEDKEVVTEEAKEEVEDKKKTTKSTKK